MPDLSTADFLRKLFDLAPGIRDSIIDDGMALLQEFNFSAEQLTSGVSDSQKGMHAALQSYFFLYLWELKLIDDKFIQAVSQASATDPQAYEKIKIQFLDIIKEIPIAMIDPIVKIYNDKLNSTEKNKTRKKKAPLPTIGLTEGSAPAESTMPVVPSAEISVADLDVDGFSQGLIQLVENVKLMISSDLHPKIEGSFNCEKTKLLNSLSKALEITPEHAALVLIVERINDVYREWAENKEQRFDAQGRSLMSFLTTGAAPIDSPPESEPVVLSMTKSFTPQYNQKKANLLPLQIITEIQRVIRETGLAMQSDKGLTMDQQIILTLRSDLFDEALKAYIRVLEHANRLVFGVQQLGSVNVTLKPKKKG